MVKTNKIVIRQGDQCAFPLPMFLGSSLLSDLDIEQIEVSIGSFIRKLYTDGDIIYDELNNQFELWLNQEDTFSLLPSRQVRGGYFEYPSLIRFKLKECDDKPSYVYSIPGPNVEVLESLSKERL